MRATKSRAKSGRRAVTSVNTAVKVAFLPAPEPIDHLPWPYFAVSAAERRRVVARQKPQTVALGTLSATVPVVALRTAPAMTIPQLSRRVSSALHPPAAGATAPAAVASAPPATRTLPGTQRPAMQPARPPRRAAPVPVTAPITIAGAVAGGPAIQAMTPRRVAGPLTPPAATGSPSLAPSLAPSSASSSASSPLPSSAMTSARRTATRMRSSSRRPIATLRLPPAPEVVRLTSWALALGLLGIICGFVTGVPAAICGHVALRRLARARDTGSLRRRAQWAIALGYATSLFWAAYVLLSVIR